MPEGSNRRMFDQRIRLRRMERTTLSKSNQAIDVVHRGISEKASAKIKEAKVLNSFLLREQEGRLEGGS